MGGHGRPWAAMAHGMGGHGRRWAAMGGDGRRWAANGRRPGALEPGPPPAAAGGEGGRGALRRRGGSPAAEGGVSTSCSFVLVRAHPRPRPLPPFRCSAAPLLRAPAAERGGISPEAQPSPEGQGKGAPEHFPGGAEGGGRPARRAGALRSSAERGDEPGNSGSSWSTSGPWPRGSPIVGGSRGLVAAWGLHVAGERGSAPPPPRREGEAGEASACPPGSSLRGTDGGPPSEAAPSSHQFFPFLFFPTP